MYNKFFGFKEKPFKLVPNPAYFYLSKSHEEALAHLNYAMSQGDGFVEITGEVGTGKTTLCRAFLESLNGTVEAAYIFNPKLSPKQLLRTINEEFGIKSEGDNTKDLIDTLNIFLMQKKASGKKVILLIDEAQNLNRNVLEQLRLLSNLETNRDKLLQIILVGQPELSQILNSHELRQLGQRITLSYQLGPLTFNESKEYIQYRIGIAAYKTAIKFDRSAYRQIYKYSKGIPRLINIVCDRALLTAFVLNQFKITANITKTSIKELARRGHAKAYGLSTSTWVLVSLSFLSIVFLGAVFYHPIVDKIADIFANPADQQTEGIAQTEKIDSQARHFPQQQESSDQIHSMATLPIGSASPAISLAAYLMNMDGRRSRQPALTHAMNLWKTYTEFTPYLQGIDDDQSYFRLSAKSSGLFIHRIETDIDFLKKLNLPAILEFYPPGSPSPGYFTLSQINGDKIILQGRDETEWIVTNLEELEFYWSGVAYLPWKNFHSIWGTIPVQTYKDSVVTLKLLLQDLGFKDVAINDKYDRLAQDAVKSIQAKYGVPVDGYVGPLTKIILYKEKNSLEMPYLSKLGQ
ncbi:MAG: AAA family ATPase [Desulfobacterales bacterium]|jgi:general secretion pathway protein A|nr:AAA family ATPase [Desulfobacterales bacterium]